MTEPSRRLSSGSIAAGVVIWRTSLSAQSEPKISSFWRPARSRVVLSFAFGIVPTQMLSCPAGMRASAGV